MIFTSPKKNNYEIPTTTKKKKKSNKRHHHRPKSKKDKKEDDRSYKRGANGLLNNGSHQILQNQMNFKSDGKYVPRSRLKNVERFYDHFEIPFTKKRQWEGHNDVRSISRALRTQAQTNYAKGKARSPPKKRAQRIDKWFEILVSFLAPTTDHAYTSIARMPKISLIPSSQWLDYLKNKSKSVIEKEKPQLTNHIEAIKNFTETVMSGLKNASVAIQQQVQEILKPQVLEGSQQQLLNETHQKINKVVNKTEEEIVVNVNNSMVIQEQVNDLVNQAGITEVINGTANLWQPWIHNVEDDAKVYNFIRHIPNHYSKLFRNLARKTTDDNWKRVFKEVERDFKNKFNEYVTETTHSKIKSRTGTERVVLNSIAVSNRIIRRLFNYILGDTNNKAFMRNNDTIDVINKLLNKRTKDELHRACLKLGICRTSRGFASYIIDILTILCGSDNAKFEGALNSISKLVKKTQFDIFGKDIENEIHKKFAQYDHVHLVYKRSLVAIVKNMIANRNSPVAVYGDSQVGQINKTMALIEIINTMDENLPDNLENLQEWNNIKSDILNYSTNVGTKHIDTIAAALLENILKAIRDLDEKPRTDVIRNTKIIFS